MQRAPALLDPRDDAPPPSGVRVRVVAAEQPDDRVLIEVAGQVCGEVYDNVRALVPLQGVWMGLGWAQLGGLALSVTRLWQENGRSPRAVCRRWHELVPGAAALDRLVWLMADLVC